MTEHQPPDAAALNDIKEEIRALALEHGALAFGVASIEETAKRAPVGHRPSDFLPGARSVIVVGFMLSTAGAVQAVDAMTQSLSSHHGMKRVFSLNAIIAHAIEKRFGYLATGLPGLPAKGDFDPHMSLKACAEAAGLGMRAISSMVINPEYGPRVFFSAIATTAPLPPDKPLTDNPCPHPDCVRMWHEKGTTLCLDACPGAAITGTLDGRTITHRVYDQLKCMPFALMSHIERFTKLLEAAIEEKDSATRKTILYGTEFQRSLYDLYWAGIEGRGTCWVCMNVCPVGKEHLELM
jgi:epoxyqueuosine reductase QueG